MIRNDKKMRYSLLTGFFTLALILGALPSIAQDKKEETDCKNPRANYEITICKSQLERQTYKEMETIYQKLQQQYQAERKSLSKYYEKRLRYLIESQEAWLKYRETQCRWIASGFEGGSMQPIVGLSCQIELNRQRIEQLSRELENYGSGG